MEGGVTLKGRLGWGWGKEATARGPLGLEHSRREGCGSHDGVTSVPTFAAPVAQAAF